MLGLWGVHRLGSPKAKTVRSERNRADDGMSDFFEQGRIAYGSDCGESFNGSVWVRFEEPVCGAKQSGAGRYDIIDQNDLWFGREVLLDRERLIVFQGVRPSRRNARGCLGYRLGPH